MTWEEIQAARAAKWSALQTQALDEECLRGFVRELGLVSFAADAGAAAGLPALSPWPEYRTEDLYALLEVELEAVRLVEIDMWPGQRLYATAELMGYLYVCGGDRRPLTEYQAQARQGKLSNLAAEVYTHMLAADGAVIVSQLRDAIGPERTSALGIERALAELAATAKVLRTGRRAGEPQWRPLVRALPHVPELIDTVSRVQAAAALVSQWLDAMICDTEENMAEFFAPVMPRSRVHSALLGLEAGKEVALESLDGRPAYRLSLRPPL